MGRNLDYVLMVLCEISATFTLLLMILLSSTSTSTLHPKYQQSIWYEAKSAAAHIISNSMYKNSNTDYSNSNNNNSTLYSAIILRIFKKRR